MEAKQRKAYAYVTAKNGMVARVPVDRVQEWSKRQSSGRGKAPDEEAQKLKAGLMEKLAQAKAARGR